MKIIYALSIVFIWASLNGVSQTPHTDYLGAGHTSSVTVITSGTGFFGIGENTINGTGLNQHMRDAARFLGQSTAGANYEVLEELSTQSYEVWIDDQMQIPEMSYLDTSKMVWDHFVQAYIDQWGSNIIEGNEDISPFSFYWRMAWWHNAIHGEDLLRQKVALALSELLVVSEDSKLNADAFGLASYYDVLYKNAFENYRDLLEEVTYHPAMGYYLSSINNESTNEADNIHPDENYAREIMQLFTIGLYELNQDGTLILDEDEMPIETYDNNDITEFARVFTGLGPAGYWNPWVDYSEEDVIWGVWYNTVPYIDATQSMVMFENYHEVGVKHLLNGAATPNGASGEEDIDIALDNLFYHQNIAPFVSKHLIMRLVKSNPTPEYVGRVAAVFENNGEGVKGDLGAVVKAVLLDDEARNCEWISNPYSGKMREPMIRYIQLLKAFDAHNNSGKMFSLGWNTSDIQHPLNSPSVFNFFLPSYAPSGPIADSSLVAPEFELLNSTVAIEYINMSFDIIWSENYMESVTLASQEDIGIPWWDMGFFNPDDRVYLDFQDENILAGLDPLAMVERLNLLLGGGTLSSETMQTIIEIIDVEYLEPSDRVKLAMYFILASPDYLIQK